MKTLDVITIGRSSVDLYGAQIGGRLEDMASFNKYIGGSPTNMACGAARLGLRSALITRVGDEHMGRFIRQQLQAEGVDVRGVITDPERLSALVLLGIRDGDHFPLIFYRENCADMALCEADINADFIAEAACVTVTGTHLSHPRTRAAVLKALRLARASGAKTALDIDYRPTLWGLSGHGDGENRFVASATVTAELQATLPLFDLIVGTEEEFHSAGGSADTLTALRAVRHLSNATLVCKRGPTGALLFDGAIGTRLEDGLCSPAFAVTVFNTLGAGDGFMAGLLKGWLSGESWQTALEYANACGALAVSRHGCTPAYPSWQELQFFLKRGVKTADLRHDHALEQIHWSTTRLGDWPEIRIFAFDHRTLFEDLADDMGVSQARIGTFKTLCLKAVETVADGRAGYGLLCDGRLGREALYAAAGRGLWIGRPVEKPGSRPLALDIGVDFASALATWPIDHVIKVLCYYHPDDDAGMKKQQEDILLRLFAAGRANRREFLLEIVSSTLAPCDDHTAATVIERFYDIGIYPDWWKLEPMQSEGAWHHACAAISRHDPYCRGVVVLGLDSPKDDLVASFAVAARHERVRGFAVGRTLFADTARQWLGGSIDDQSAVTHMAKKYRALCQAWDRARKNGGGAA